MYKSLALAALLLPFYGYSITKEVRIKELKETQFKILLELDSLKELIFKCQERLKSNLEQYTGALEASVNTKKEQLDSLAEKTGDKKLDKEAIQKMLGESNKLIYEDLLDAIFGKKEFKHSLFHELFDVDTTKPIGIQTYGEIQYFYNDKLLVVSTIIDLSLATIAVEKYERLLQELIKINKEIVHLESK